MARRHNRGMPTGRIPCDRLHVDKLLGILTSNDGVPITAPRIQNRLGYAAEQTSQSTRALIAFAIETCKIPIVSSSKGYWIATSHTDIRVCCDSLGHRIMGLQKRQCAISEAWSSWAREKDSSQMRLFVDP